MCTKQIFNDHSSLISFGSKAFQIEEVLRVETGIDPEKSRPYYIRVILKSGQAYKQLFRSEFARMTEELMLCRRIEEELNPDEEKALVKKMIWKFPEEV